MKTAIYIEDGVVQLVITPTSDFEKDALKSFKGKPVKAEIYHGTFYDCRGGWTRQEDYPMYSDGNGDHSLIIRTEAG